MDTYTQTMFMLCSKVQIKNKQKIRMGYHDLIDDLPKKELGNATSDRKKDCTHYRDMWI